MQRKHLLQHEHRAINTEVGGFTSSPAISPSTVRANRNNHSFRSSTTVQPSSSFGNYFFTTLVLTKYRNVLSHVKGWVRNHSQKDSLPAPQQKLVLMENHLLVGVRINKGFNLFHHSQRNSTHHPQSLTICTFVLQKTGCLFFTVKTSLTQFYHCFFSNVIFHCSSCVFNIKQVIIS